MPLKKILPLITPCPWTDIIIVYDLTECYRRSLYSEAIAIARNPLELHMRASTKTSGKPLSITRAAIVSLSAK